MAPLYTASAAVKSRLVGKVRFGTDPTDENTMDEDLLLRLIDEAESEVELDLSPRYMAPFQGIDDGAFSTLPARPTQNLLATMCELKSVIRVLETDFGRSSASDGAKYIESLHNRYKATLEKLLQKKTDGLGWAYPPLPGLKLNWHNQAADDGYAGTVLVSSSGQGGFPKHQINDPSENFFNGVMDE